ncbi:hypothetical protein LEMLEM_LOCUS13084, partial [Lemmus lemmus]
MTAITVWLIYIFQCNQQKSDLMQNSNNSYPSTKQNISSFNKTLTNKSPENEDCKQEEQNRCC